MVLYAGIDETRKSPVLGSIVLCVALVPEEDEELLRKKGVKDSKQIEQNKLHRLAKELKQKYAYKVIKIKPYIISQAENLNLLEAKYIVKLIKWSNKYAPKYIYLDSLTANIQTCYNYFYTLNFKQSNFKIIPKADEKIISVQVASIIAKYYSDKEIEYLKRKYPDMGSGEPYDKQTIAFLKKHLHNPPKDCIRTNWITFKRLLENDKNNL